MQHPNCNGGQCRCGPIPKGPGGAEITETRLVKEYAKGKDGVVYAKKMLVQHDGKTFIESETVEHKYLEKLDDSEFKK